MCIDNVNLWASFGLDWHLDMAAENAASLTRSGVAAFRAIR